MLKLFVFISITLLTGCNTNSGYKVVKVELDNLDGDSSEANTKNHSSRTFEDQFSVWINGITRTEKPGKKIIAYKFGIFETPEVPSGYYLYLIGANRYDQNNDDWAAGFGDFKPANTYLALPEKEFRGVKWDSVQSLIKARVKRFVNSESFKKSFFNDAKAIAVGFDQGELVRIK